MKVVSKGAVLPREQYWGASEWTYTADGYQGATTNFHAKKGTTETTKETSDVVDGHHSALQVGVFRANPQSTEKLRRSYQPAKHSLVVAIEKEASC